MPDIRLIALDLDGTVFDDEKRISPRISPSVCGMPLPRI